VSLVEKMRVARKNIDLGEPGLFIWHTIIGESEEKDA
jgi:hypothetical protein